jgi:uncharacterized protein
MLHLHLAPVGKMALTSYLMQSVVGALVFFGIGLGALVRMGNSQTLLLGMLVVVGQVLFCRAWLCYFQFGPVEWVWRMATYRRWQPLRRAAGPAVQTAPV